MKELLQKLALHISLSEAEAQEAMVKLASGETSPTHMAAFLTAYQLRTPTLDELSGFAQALLQLCIPVQLAQREAMDLCGTGGDGKDTFNISTTSAFVVAAAGVPVVKHGNYGISSFCGSSTLMEYLGIGFTADVSVLQQQLDCSNICFLHAPLFHPALKHVAPVRREMGLKTFFNMLGPLVNPALPSKQLAGVFNLELARMYAYYGQRVGKQLTVIHDLNGYDEVSLTGPVKVFSTDREVLVNPEEIGLRTWKENDLRGGDRVSDSAQIFTRVLQGQGSEAQTEVVLANAGLALSLSGDGAGWKLGIEKARTVLENGSAWECFMRFKDIQHQTRK